MTIAARIGAVSANAETATRTREFIAMCKVLGLTDGTAGHARMLVDAMCLPDRIADMIENGLGRREIRQKAPVAPLSTTEASALATYDSIATAFLGSLGGVGAFDKMLPSMTPMPVRTRALVVSTGATAFMIGQGQAKRLTTLAIDDEASQERKAVGEIVLSLDLLRFSGPLGSRLLEQELRKAVAKITDVEFLSVATAGVSPITASGGSLRNLREDLRSAFAGIASDDSARFFIVMPSAVLKNIALSGDGDDAAFRDLTMTGGSIRGATVVPSDAATDIVVLDASQFGADGGSIEMTRARHASVQLDGSPDSPAGASTVATSLWQHDLVALRAERYFACARLRTASVAVITGGAYHDPNSPPT